MGGRGGGAERGELNRICGGNLLWTNILSKLQRVPVASVPALWTLSQTHYSLVLSFNNNICVRSIIAFLHHSILINLCL